MTEKDGVWYTDAACTEKAAPILSALAETEIGRVSVTVPTVKLGYVFGFAPVYAAEDDKTVVGWTENGQPVADGLRAALADLTVADLEDEKALTDACRHVRTGEVLGYTVDENGVWYTDAAMTEKASALMQILCPSEVELLSQTVNSTAIGRLLGYTEVPDGTWYTEWSDDGNAENDVPLSGICPHRRLYPPLRTGREGRGSQKYRDDRRLYRRRPDRPVYPGADVGAEHAVCRFSRGREAGRELYRHGSDPFRICLMDRVF